MPRHRNPVRMLILVPVVAGMLMAGCRGNASPSDKSSTSDFTEPVIVNRTQWKHRLVVRSFGGPAEWAGKDCLQMVGVSASIQDIPTGQHLFDIEASEAENDLRIDFSHASEGVYIFTQYTTDPREPESECVPLLETEVRVDEQRHCRIYRLVRLKAEEGGSAKIAHWRDVALADPHDTPEFDQALGHLRNLSLTHLQEVEQAMQAIQPHTDGHAAEIWNSYDAEIHLINPSHPPHSGNQSSRIDPAQDSPG